jgi:hypothetical protein
LQRREKVRRIGWVGAMHPNRAMIGSDLNHLLD